MFRWLTCLIFLCSWVSANSALAGQCADLETEMGSGNEILNKILDEYNIALDEEALAFKLHDKELIGIKEYHTDRIKTEMKSIALTQMATFNRYDGLFCNNPENTGMEQKMGFAQAIMAHMLRSQ